MATAVDIGQQVTDTAEATAGRPNWMQWASAGNLAGTVKAPAGYRRMAALASGTRTEKEYFTNVQGLPDTEADWQVGIIAPNGCEITADGMTGFPTVGTPTVRLTESAPAKAVVRVPVARGAMNILDPAFAGWTPYEEGGDPYTGPVERGMELVVRYRTGGQMQYAFRGQIYQIEGADIITITAYDRLMDLYQFSDQYQAAQGRNTEWRDRIGSNETDYLFTSTETIGTMIAVSERDILRIDDLAKMAYGGGITGYVVHQLPQATDSNNVTHGPHTGDVIRRVATDMGGIPHDFHFTNIVRLKCRIIAAHKAGTLLHPTFEIVYTTDWQEYELEGSGHHAFAWDVNWPVFGWGWIGAEYRYDIIRGRYDHVGGSSTSTPYITSGVHWTSESGTGWDGPHIGDPLPEISVDFTEAHDIPLASITASGNMVGISKSVVPSYTGEYLSTVDLAAQAYLDYLVLQGAALQSIVRDLMEAAGLDPVMPAGIDLGATTYYTTSTFDYLTCIHELIRGADYGLLSGPYTPGDVHILPRHTTDDEPVATFSADMDPATAGERIILAHDLTQHWMAEKATVACIAENATSSGLPLALETDDELMDGSLVKALQSPLRGIGTDTTLGTHKLMAVAAGGKIIQLHTNTVEGEITVAGYRTDVWELIPTDQGGRSGGKPVRVIVPDAGVDAVAIPTEVEIGDGSTRITLDNIRRPDRSEVARSMGLTADAMSNTTQQLPKTCYAFAKVDTYATQETGITPGTVASVQWLKDGGTVAAQQTDSGYIRTVEDAAGYFHVCAVMPASLPGYAPDSPITHLAFTMDGTTYRAVLNNPKYALGGQALHADIRFRKA